MALDGSLVDHAAQMENTHTSSAQIYTRPYTPIQHMNLFNTHTPTLKYTRTLIYAFNRISAHTRSDTYTQTQTYRHWQTDTRTETRTDT